MITKEKQVDTCPNCGAQTITEIEDGYEVGEFCPRRCFHILFAELEEDEENEMLGEE